MEVKNYFAQDDKGNILPNASVYLYKKGTNTLASVFDKNGYQKTNPFTAESNGLVQFSAVDGEYDLRISSGGRDYTISVSLLDTLRLHFESVARSIGCELADGSFDGGSRITNPNQVVLFKNLKKIYKYHEDIFVDIEIDAGTDPVMSEDWIDVTNLSIKDMLHADNGYSLLESGGKQIPSGKHVTLSRMQNGGTWEDLVYAIENYESIEIDKDISRKSEIIAPITLKRIFGNGVINTCGNRVFTFKRTVIASANVFSITDSASDLNAMYVDRYTKIAVDNINGFEVGQAVKVAGNNNQTLWGRVSYITPAIIAVDTPLDFSVSAIDCKIEAISEFDCDVDVRLSGSGLTDTNIVLASCGVNLNIRSSTGKANVLTISGAYNDVKGNIKNANIAVLGYDCGPNKVHHIKVDRSKDGLRFVRPHMVEISHWEVTNGSSKSYSTGVELTAETGIYDKNSRCSVDFGDARAVNIGVPGSGIGGIHLNFNAKYHSIKFNKSRFNSIGIYLENSASHNDIIGNDASNNHGYYGTGIQLDADCSYNTIELNNTNNNGGSTAAAESWGIEVRNGPNNKINEIDNLTHSCNYNIIINNTSMNNHTGAYKVNGVGNTFDNNKGGGTSSSRFSGYGMFHSTDSEDLNIGGLNNIDASGSLCTYTMYISGAKGFRLGSSKLKSSGSQINTLLIENGYYATSNITLDGTRISSACSQRGIKIKGDSSKYLYRVKMINVELDHAENGYPPYELDYCDNYKIQNIELIGASTTARVLYNCTNRKGMAVAQVDSVATDIATLRTDLNALMAKLRSDCIISS